MLDAVSASLIESPWYGVLFRLEVISPIFLTGLHVINIIDCVCIYSFIFIRLFHRILYSKRYPNAFFVRSGCVSEEIDFTTMSISPDTVANHKMFESCIRRNPLHYTMVPLWSRLKNALDMVLPARCLPWPQPGNNNINLFYWSILLIRFCSFDSCQRFENILAQGR